MDSLKQKYSSIILPICFLICIIFIWELSVFVFHIPEYLLPRPQKIAISLINNFIVFIKAGAITLSVSLFALILSIIFGVIFAVLIFQFKMFEKAVAPYTIILQTTPIVSIIPLLIIWFKSNTYATLVICAWIASIFPIISSTLTGLKSTDKSLVKMFKIYNASPIQTLTKLYLPSSLPYFMSGLKISGALSLIGGVSAEFIAGTGGKASGVAYLLLMSGYNLETDKLFASLFIISTLGLLMHSVLSFLNMLLLKKWHDSSNI